MSVEKDGVQGYEYQYLCSILIALNLFKNNRDVQSIYIEKYEDAYFEIVENKQTWSIYFQGKKHDKKITLNDLCIWLSHYGERQFGKSMLERIVSENANLIIFSFGRCEDAIVKFTEYDENSYTNNFTAKIGFIDNFKNQIICSMNEGTDIENKRKLNMEQFLNKVNKQDLKNALKKICICEQLKKDKVESIISETLNKEFNIRKRDVDGVIFRLDKCVRNGRDTTQNIKDDFLRIIESYAHKLLKGDYEYISPPQYQELVDCIEKNNVLLITGVPFCGKTITARYIAEKFQKEGYTIAERDMAIGDNSAYSFLCDSQFDDSKLVIISDPFGGYEKNLKISEVKRKIETIINNYTDSCRKVIVTTRKDILLETFNKDDLHKCSISGNHWYDLSMCDLEFAKKIWINLYKDSLNSKVLFDKIQKSLYKDNCTFLEVGEIFHLHTKYKTIEDFQELSENDIINESRISAEDIKNRIKNSGTDFVATYIALGLSCNSVRSVNINDLAFVLSDSEETPGIVERRSIGVNLFGSSKHFPFPSYSVSYILTQKQKDILKYFRDSGYIYIDKTNKIVFSHPIYHFVSQKLFEDEMNDVFSDRDVYDGLIKRCISALDKNINIVALGFIEHCFERIKDNSIIDLVLFSLNSIFPATKDRALRILEDNYENLNDEQVKIFINALEKDFYSVYLCWKDNEPYYNCSDEIGLGDFYYDEEINGTANANNLEYIYKMLSSENNTLDMTFLENACKLDESMIRKLAYSKIIKNYGKIINIDKYLIDDENSNVIVGIMQAAFEAWDDFSEDAQNKIIRFFEHQSNKLPVLVLSQSFIESGNNDYSEYRSFQISYLEAWCRITTIYLNKCPVKYIKIDEYKISALINQIEKNHHKLDESIILEFIQSWRKWLEKDVFPNDYGLYIMGFLIRTISKGNRFELFKELLNCNKTSYITSHIHYLINGWELLSYQEKNEVHNLVLSNRSDTIWIKAIIINSGDIPEEMKDLILGKGIDISDIKGFVEILREKGLLEPCLNIFCGYPQPLWWLGYHHNRLCKERWNSVIEEVLLSEYTDEHTYRIALREFVDNMYNHCNSFSSDIWINLLHNKKKRVKLFKQLMQVSATQNQNNKKMWMDYFNSCEDDELDNSIQTIIDNIEVINYHLLCNSDLFNQFDFGFFFKKIYPKLYNDYSIFTFCFLMKETISSLEKILNDSENDEYLFENSNSTPSQDIYQNKNMMIQTIKKQYKEKPPRMLFTNKYVSDAIKELKIDDDELNSIIEKHRLLLIEKGRSMIDKFDDQYKLKNWVE